MKQGDLVGARYKVGDLVGQGGMQTVHRATDTLVGVDVAIKTPIDGKASQRFAQSAIFAGKVNNHYVAKTLDYVEENGMQYLVEELVSGTTMRDGILALAGYVDPHLAAKILSKLAMGVAASHQAGVIHRDLKPSNILVRGAYNLDEIKITDFGISTLTEQLFDDEIANGGDLTKSTSGTVKGALPYMAPEMMFRKKGDFVGSEADIWSLGALMYELLAGQTPFGEGFMVPANISNRKREAWPTFMVSNESFAPLARSLQAIIESCLAWERADRPSAADLVRQVEDLCYYSDERSEGTIVNIPHVFGFIMGEKGKAFFHPQNVYGRNVAKVGKRAFYCLSAGNPHPRAFPMVVEK